MKNGFINILIYLFIPTLFISLLNPIIEINKITYFIFTLFPYLTLTIYFILKYKKVFLDNYKKINKKNLFTMIIIWIIGFLLMMLSNYIINYLLLDNTIASNEQNNRLLLSNNLILYTILFTILIPILEEISFRLEFKKNIKNKYIFILLSSFTFALVHINFTNIIEFIYLIPYFILGATFSLIYYKTDCIYMNILTHIIHNTICIGIITLF